MKINLPFTVPVAVIVDTETGKVDAVYVIDESITRDLTAEVWDDDTARALWPAHPEVLKAWHIADSEDGPTWPSWEFGR